MLLNDNQNIILQKISENLKIEDVNNFIKISNSIVEFYKNQISNNFGKFLEILYLEGFLKINIENLDLQKETLNKEEAEKELEEIKKKIINEAENVKSLLEVNIFDFYKNAAIIEQSLDICFIKSLYQKGLIYQSKLSYDFENGKEKILNIFLNTYKFGTKIFQESLSKEVEELKLNNNDYDLKINNNTTLLENISNNPSLLKEKIK
jgi:hypothetical protein